MKTQPTPPANAGLLFRISIRWLAYLPLVIPDSLLIGPLYALELCRWRGLGGIHELEREQGCPPLLCWSRLRVRRGHRLYSKKVYERARRRSHIDWWLRWKRQRQRYL